MRKINYFIFPIVLVLFIFLSIFKFPQTNATSGTNQTSEIPANIFEGIYYIDGYNAYIWIVKNEIPEDTRFGATYLDQDGVFHEYDTFYFGDMVYNTGDIQQLNPQGSYFVTIWRDVDHINRLVDAGYLFYDIRFGVSKPFVDVFYKMEYYGSNKIIPIYPKQKIDHVFNYIDYLGEITEEDLLAEYNRGYDEGYTDGYDVGGEVGFEDGYNKAYEEINTNDE